MIMSYEMMVNRLMVIGLLSYLVDRQNVLRFHKYLPGKNWEASVSN